MVAALFTVTLGMATPLAAFGVFLPVLEAAFGWSRGAIALALSINLVLGGLVGFWLGALADRYGPRTVLTLTVLLEGVGFALVSTVGALWQFYVLVGVLVGVGMSGMYVVTTATVARWFEDRRRGLALGIVLTGLNLGYVTGGPLAARLIEGLGWRQAYVVLGGLLCVVGGLASLTVRDPASAPSRSPAAAWPAFTGFTFREALGSPRLWFFEGSWLLTGGVFMTVAVHVVPFALDRGLDLATASLAITAYGVGAATGRSLFGAAGDRFGTVATTRLCFALQVVTLSLLLTGPPPWLLQLLLLGFGFGFAGADTMTVKVVAETFGVRAIGAIMAAMAFGWRLGAAVGPALAGFVHDATSTYTLPFGAAPLAVLLAAVLFDLGARGRSR